MGYMSRRTSGSPEPPAPPGYAARDASVGLTENEKRASPENENEILLLVPLPGHAN